MAARAKRDPACHRGASSWFPIRIATRLAPIRTTSARKARSVVVPPGGRAAVTSAQERRDVEEPPDLEAGRTDGQARDFERQAAAVEHLEIPQRGRRLD